MAARRSALLGALAAATLAAQAPMAQDGASANREARMEWLQGQMPLGPSSMPSLEVGWGGSSSDPRYAPLLGGEGLGHGARGWGIGLQGRYVSGGWTMSATLLGLRNHGSTQGLLHRAALAYQPDSGWRVALEQAPFAWGSSLLGGELLGDAARAFPRLSLATPPVPFLKATWRLEAFHGRLEADPVIPVWAGDRPLRQTARDAILDQGRPTIQGARLRVNVGSLVEAGLGAVALRGGAAQEPTRTQSLLEAKVRLPFLAEALRARGAALHASRSASPDGSAPTLASARSLVGGQVVWDAWDLGLEVAGAAPLTPLQNRSVPPAGFSTHGDALGDAYWRTWSTRTMTVGLPLFLEGRGRFLALRATTSAAQPGPSAAWFLQVEGQWRTSTGRLGASLASLRQEHGPAGVHWGWTASLFQAFRVF